MKSTIDQKQSGELTGRTVLAWLLGFFGVIFAVNAVLVEAATSTFSGLERANPYKAGIAYEQDIAAAKAQNALQWSVTGKLKRAASGATQLDVVLRDRDGKAPDGINLEAELMHPTDARRDHRFVLHATGSASFAGDTRSDAGQWDLVIDVFRGDERLYRSTDRIILR